ncbi:MAG: hypothetical protein IKJ80_01500 [Clostridia bacterium]|nr:hypothetical protein [Clostridia bacterium]
MKTVGIVSNIVLSVVYAASSWIISFLGLMLYVYTPKENISIAQIFLLMSSIIFICTILFCAIGIILSIILRKKEKYIPSLIIQFLPFATVAFATFLMIVSMILGNT